MAHTRIFVALLSCIFALLAGCSKTAANADTARKAAADATATQTSPGNACERKLITPEDAAGILTAPVTGTKNIPGDPQSCKFDTAGYASLTVSVRPGHGKAAVGMYTSGKMDEFDKSAPLSGVGDEAVRSLGLQRVTARKDNLLCEITGPGLTRPDDPMPQKLGALCNKIFAAY
jgi:hypothetical protein